MACSSAEVFRRFTRSVFDAQAALLKHGDAANAEFGQTSARWRVLQRISAGQTSVAAIARSTGYSRQGVQRLADALVSEGSARYSADESDRRRQHLELTGAGTATFERMEAHFDVWAARLTARIPEADLVAVGGTLERIRLVVLADAENGPVPWYLPGAGRCGTMQARSAAAPSRPGGIRRELRTGHEERAV